MYRTIADFKNDWAHENEMTQKIFARLKDPSLNHRVSPEGRTLGFLAWHIVVSLGMATEAGLKFAVPGNYESSPPEGAAAIQTAYEKHADELVALVEKHWTDANLLEEVQMYGMAWTRGYALLAMVKHQAHHRGQMTVLMRQAGLTFPGPYGPAREEWEAMGMKPLP